MKIGVFDINSQLNMNSPFSAESIKRVDINEITKDNAQKVSEKSGSSLKLEDSYEHGINNSKVTYDKFAPVSKVSSAKVRELDDFSINSVKEDTIHSRNINNSDEVNYKEIITDEEMDSFLKKAFKLFNTLE